MASRREQVPYRDQPKAGQFPQPCDTQHAHFGPNRDLWLLDVAILRLENFLHGVQLDRQNARMSENVMKLNYLILLNQFISCYR